MTKADAEEEHLTNLNNENRALQQKLQSKTEALLILSKELQRVRSECDDYKKLTDSLQKKCSSYKSVGFTFNPSTNSFNTRSYQDSVFGKTISDLRLENKRLLNERDKLRTLLTDREEDVKAIRRQFVQQSQELKAATSGNPIQKASCNTDLLERLERLQMKYDSIRKDIQVYSV